MKIRVLAILVSLLSPVESDADELAKKNSDRPVIRGNSAPIGTYRNKNTNTHQISTLI